MKRSSTSSALRDLLTYQFGGSLAFWIVIPIGISFLSYRHGWSEHRPGIANLCGVLPLTAGLALATWANVEHIRKARRHGWHPEMIRFEASQYLIESGPYRYTRNPIYLSHLLVLSGWALFFGSIAVAIVAAITWVSLATVILPYEQRRLAEKFGPSYAAYCSRAPRWIGLPSRNQRAPETPRSRKFESDIRPR